MIRVAGRVSFFALIVVLGARYSLASAQWNPTAGQWGKAVSTDLRVMTWNVHDAICSTNSKVSGQNNWCAVARTIAAFRPDVLLLQECADNNGNGTGSTMDSVAALTTTIGYLLHGGNDSFKSGNPPVTAYVQLYAPGYDLPYVFVTTENDGFNRNVILSRRPFVDLNGDGKTTMDNIPTITADLYSPGGDGGIRGFQTAEIDLSNTDYAGNLVVGNCHLKASSGTSNHNQRVTAGKNIAYFIDYFWNGAGGAVPDPRAKIADSPAATSVLDANTSVIVGGDWNEDETQNGATIGPADWITRAQTFDFAGGADGPDRNRTDMTYDSAVDFFSGSNFTIGTIRFDYLAWQDSMVTPRVSFLFDSATVVPAAAMPPEFSGWGANVAGLSGIASDHSPKIADFILPRPIPCNTATDRGFASLSGAGVYPRFGVCGGLATGGTASVALTSAPALQTAYLAVSLAAGFSTFGGATIVPQGPLVLGPYQTDALGSVALAFPGGGGPLTVFAQWGVLDAQSAGGFALSNAVSLSLLP